MDPGAGQSGQLDVAVDHQLLGDRGPAGQAELAAAPSLVHDRPPGEAGDLAVLGEHHVEAQRVLHRPAHQQRVLHAVAVVGEDAHAGGGELGVRRQRLARPAHRDAAGRQHLAQPGLLALGPHELDDAPRVLGGIGVRHGDDAVNPPRAAARLPVSIVSASSRPGSRRWTWRSTKPGRDDAAAGVEHRRRPSDRSRTHGGDAATVDQHVGPPLARADRRPCRP